MATGLLKVPNGYLRLGDCAEVMAHYPANSAHAVICDPPYNLSFMSRKWDSLGGNREFQQWCERWSHEALRVLRPGGYLLAFGSPRTYHRLASGVEDAGFTIRDSLHWLYGQGMPHGLDLSKAFDKKAGAERKVVGTRVLSGNAALSVKEKGGGTYSVGVSSVGKKVEVSITAPATELAREWAGWNTVLKPGHEPIVVAQKPLEGTFAQNVAKWGVGGLNVAATRPARDGGEGRYPPNALLTHGLGCSTGGCAPGCPVAELDAQSGVSGGKYSPPKARRRSRGFGALTGEYNDGASGAPDNYGDSGGASRYFPILDYDEADFWPFRYVAKATPKERDAGLADFDLRVAGGPGGRNDGPLGSVTQRRNSHPTVKPVRLCQWLIRLVLPPGSVLIDPFMGSGSMGVAAARERVRYIGIENDPQWLPLAEARIIHEIGLLGANAGATASVG